MTNSVCKTIVLLFSIVFLQTRAVDVNLTFCLVADEISSPYRFVDQFIIKPGLDYYQEWANTPGNFRVGTTDYKVQYITVDGGTACAGGSQAQEEGKQSDLDDALKVAYTNLIDSGNCDLYLAPFGSVRANPISNLTAERNVPLVSIASANRTNFDGVTKPRFWTPFQDFEDIILPTYRKIYASGARTLAILDEAGESSIDYKGLLIKFGETNPDQAMTLVYENTVQLVGDLDGKVFPSNESVHGIIDEMDALGDDAIDVIVWIGGTSNLVQVLSLFSERFVSPKAIWSVNDAESIGSRLSGLEGIVTTVIWHPTLDLPGDPAYLGGTTEFVDVYTAAVGRSPNLFTATAVIAPMLFQMAMTDNSCSDKSNLETFYSCIQTGMGLIDRDTFYGRVNLNENGQNTLETQTLQLFSNEKVPITGANAMVYPAGFPERQNKPPNTILSIIFCLLAGLMISICIMLLFAINKFGDVTVIRSASQFYLSFILGGCIIHYLAIFFTSFEANDVFCVVSVWLNHFGFIVGFGALLVKTHRVDQVFRSRQKTKLNDLWIFKFMLTPLVLLYTIYLIVWTIVDIPLAEKVIDDNIQYSLCSFGIFDFVIIGLEMAILLWASILAFKVRNAPSAFNEATLIGASVYNWIVISIICTVIYFLVPRTSDSDAIIAFVYVWVPTTIMIVLIFFPKMYLLFKKKGDLVETKSTFKFTNTKNSIYETVHRTQNLEDVEGKDVINNLKNEIDNLIAENAELKGTLMMCNNIHVQGDDDDCGSNHKECASEKSGDLVVSSDV